MTQNNNGDFIPARGFNNIVGTARRVVSNDGLWFPVFADSEQALAFTRYVGGFARRVCPGAITRSRPQHSIENKGFVAVLSVEFPGWGIEQGVVLCKNEQVVGLALVESSRTILLPVKPYTHTVRTQSDTLYVCFADGTAFCRSKSNGPIAAADSIFFALSGSEASHVHANGGVLTVSRTPQVNSKPIYINGPAQLVGSKLALNKGSFRLGTRVVDIHNS